MPYANGIPTPSEQIEAVLRGEVAMQDAPASIQSAAQLPIYQAAQTIIAGKTLAQRRAMLDRIPERVRPYVAAEVKRLWALRQQRGST